MRYSLILRNRRKWRYNFLTLGDNSLEIRRYEHRPADHARRASGNAPGNAGSLNTWYLEPELKNN